jgi:argininosuccinate lyase
MGSQLPQPQSGAQLWSKDLPLDAAVHAFTVGEDPKTDLHLLPFDAWASAAHARTLHAAGLLSTSHAKLLVGELERLRIEALKGHLLILPEQEDGHTLLEAELTTRLGEPGRRIHLGRSRNDQVATAFRMWMREQVLQVGATLQTLASALLDFAKAHEGDAWPGYTHLRRAMPSSAAQWAGAVAEGLLEELEALQGLWARLDRCPLGTGAGYGVPLPLDRSLSADLLGFTRLHRNAAEVQAGRGRHEAALLHQLASLALTLERFSADAILFSTEEFGFLKLPDAFTTGSSLMPQKRNPDVLELARARARELRGRAALVDHLVSGLSGGYHRDFQLLKAPVVEAVAQALQLLGVLTRVVPGFEVLDVPLTPELHATQAACERAAEGEPFRAAYKAVAKAVMEGTFTAPEHGPHSEATGGPGALDLASPAADLLVHRAWFAARRAQLDVALARTFDLSTLGA